MERYILAPQKDTSRFFTSFMLLFCGINLCNIEGRRIDFDKRFIHSKADFMVTSDSHQQRCPCSGDNIFRESQTFEMFLYPLSIFRFKLMGKKRGKSRQIHIKAS